VSFGYTLNFDLVTDAASRGFPVLACHLATPYDRRCIARFPSVSMSFGYTRVIHKYELLNFSWGTLPLCYTLWKKNSVKIWWK